MAEKMSVMMGDWRLLPLEPGNSKGCQKPISKETEKKEAQYQID